MKYVLYAATHMQTQTYSYIYMAFWTYTYSQPIKAPRRHPISLFPFCLSSSQHLHGKSVGVSTLLRDGLVGMNGCYEIRELLCPPVMAFLGCVTFPCFVSANMIYTQNWVRSCKFNTDHFAIILRPISWNPRAITLSPAKILISLCLFIWIMSFSRWNEIRNHW